MTNFNKYDNEKKMDAMDSINLLDLQVAMAIMALNSHLTPSQKVL